ncbi:extracellular solute-binding protein [Methylobacterium sp. JK268]
MRATRRRVLGLAAGAAFAGTLPRPACAQAAQGAQGAVAQEGAALPGPERHGLSIFGELKYPADFPRFDYVDPMAPKGGTFSTQISSGTGNQSLDTFNTLNIYVLKGDGAAGMNLTFDSLMTRALDEPDALYGLVARSVRASSDGLAYRFALRPQARFHDGTRLTARDVVFSIRILKEKGHPVIAALLRDVVDAVAEGDEAVTVTFAPGRSRDLPLTVAGLPIFSAAFYAGRDFEASTLEAPLGSGPYQVARFEVGRFIAFERVRDYWGADLPVNVGQNNVDEIRYEYFRDRDVAFEAFKAGAFTWREEFTSRIWATGYDFPALKEGRVKRETVPDATPLGTQGWFFNTRRAVFKDPRIREAIGLAFDFEWSNQNLMYGAYRRTASFFENSELKAEGPPGPEELALLDPFRGRVPDEVFGAPVPPPRSDGSGQDRALLRRADTLLREAGCIREGGQLKLPDGKPLAFEFLDASPVFQPLVQPFIKNLGLLGIRASSRMVDPAQYQARVKDFDFDVMSIRLSGSATPGADLREVFGSRSAATPGSQNYAGIADPVIDAMLDRVATAASRAELTVACKALDRCLRAGRYWVPMWYSGSHRLALWDLYGRPDPLPRYGLGAPAIWWVDAARARRIGRG